MAENNVYSHFHDMPDKYLQTQKQTQPKITVFGGKYKIYFSLAALHPTGNKILEAELNKYVFSTTTSLKRPWEWSSNCYCPLQRLCLVIKKHSTQHTAINNPKSLQRKHLENSHLCFSLMDDGRRGGWRGGSTIEMEAEKKDRRTKVQTFGLTTKERFCKSVNIKMNS